MDITVRKLKTGDDTKDFDCGNPALNEFLRRYALTNQRRMVGVTYVAFCRHQGAPSVLGYYTLTNTAIPREGLPEKMLKGLPKYQSLPAFLIGRIAVDKAYQRKQIGELLLSRCLENCLICAKVSGARYVITEALLDAVPWYERFNFVRIDTDVPTEYTKMFLDLHVVRSAIDERLLPPTV